MNGPQHYRRAEDLIIAAMDAATIAEGSESDASDVGRARNLAAAQVHATLALVGVMAEIQFDGDPGDWGQDGAGALS